jgi:putative ABC transport system permease protein
MDALPPDRPAAELQRLAAHTVTQLRHAARSLWQHRLRAILSTLGVVCGVSTFVVMMGIGEGAKRATLQQIEQLGIRNVLIRTSVLSPEQRQHARSLGSLGLSLADGERVRHGVGSVREVAAVREIKVTALAASREFAPQVLAVTPNFPALQGLALNSGRSFVEEDARARNLVCLLGYRVAFELGAAGKLGESLRLNNGICRIVGVLQRFDRKSSRQSAISARDFDNSILLPLGADFDLAADATADDAAVSELVVALGDAHAVLPSLPLVRRVIEIAHRGADDYQVVAPQELLKQANQAQRTFNFILGSIAGIALLVGGIGIMNIMLASVTERIREIGIRRALGATRQHILRQFLTEAVILTTAGGVLGLALGSAGVWLVSALADWPVAIDAWVLAAPLASAVLTGLFFGLYPARQAALMDPIEALRHD